MKDDEIKAAIKFLVRVAIQRSVVLVDLFEILRQEYEEAERAEKPKDASKGERFETAGVGCFVTYVDDKKGAMCAHVLEVMGPVLKLRVHQTAQPDFDVDNVEYSARPKKKHWSYR